MSTQILQEAEDVSLDELVFFDKYYEVLENCKTEKLSHEEVRQIVSIIMDFYEKCRRYSPTVDEIMKQLDRWKSIIEFDFQALSLICPE